MTDELPPLRDVIERHGLAAKKSLGQHFLLDLNITRKIARLAQLSPADTALEIGPGPGGLTRALLETGATVIAIERDQRCINALAPLSQHFDGRLTLIADDALKATKLDAVLAHAPFVIVANLPYNISTELLIRWLKAGPDFWRRMTLMFQKEVADRILAAPGGKTYGRLSVIAQALAAPQRAFELPARAFTPPPKVDSAVVVFDPPQREPVDFSALEKVTQAAFSQRRKMLRSSLKPLFGANLAEILDGTNIEATARAEELTVENYLALSAKL